MRNLYVADFRNDTVRQLVLATGVVTTVAGAAGMAGSTDGTGTAARFMQPTGVALDGAGSLYISDSGNNTVRKSVLATGGVTTYAGVVGQVGVKPGPFPGGLSFPAAVVVSGAGELFIVDSHENAVLAVH